MGDEGFFSDEYANWQAGAETLRPPSFSTPSPKEQEISSLESGSGTHLEGGSCEILLFELIGDGRVIGKPFNGEKGLKGYENIPVGTMYKRERAAYLVDRYLELGLVPPTVIRDVWGSIGSAQEYIPDAKTLREEKIDFTNHALKIDLQKMWLFDVLIQNVDRHLANVLAKKEKLYAIDHGLCFGDYMPKSVYPTSGEDLFEEATTPFISLAQNTEALAELAAELEELLSESELAYFMARVETLSNKLKEKSQLDLFDVSDIHESGKTGEAE